MINLEKNRLCRFILWFAVTVPLLVMVSLLKHDLKAAILLVAPFSILISVSIVPKWEKKVVLGRLSILAFVLGAAVVVTYYLLFYY